MTVDRVRDELKQGAKPVEYLATEYGRDVLHELWKADEIQLTLEMEYRLK